MKICPTMSVLLLLLLRLFLLHLHHRHHNKAHGIRHSAFGILSCAAAAAATTTAIMLQLDLFYIFKTLQF